MKLLIPALAILLAWTLWSQRGEERGMKGIGEGPILTFGDSLTYGYGVDDPSTKSYPAILSHLSGRRVVNAGVNGETSAEGLQRIDRLLRRYRPALTILCLGGNDFLRGLPEEKLRENLAAIIRKILAHGSALLLVGVPRLNLLGLSAHPLYADLAEEFDLPLEEEALPAILSDPRLKSDSIHPNAKGYRILAEKIYEKLKEEGVLSEE
ncbi:arylesterase [Nitratifractor sp.]